MRTIKRACIAALFAATLLPLWAEAAWTNKQRGFAVLPSSRESLCSENFFQSVRNMKSIGISMVTLRIPWSQQTPTDSMLFRYSRTPNDDALRCGIEFIQSQSLEFALDLVINTTAWRASIDPDDRDLWFQQMGTIAEKYAREFAEPYGAKHLSVGTEMYRLVSNQYNAYNAAAPGRYRWPDIIADVRTEYTGIVTYSAQHSGSHSAVFEDNDLLANIDVLGFSAYWPLYASDRGSLLLEWARIERETILPARERYGKRIVFGEVGYRPCNYTFERPYDPDSPCTYDGAAQALAWDALLTYFSNTPYLDGLTGAWLWRDDPALGGIGDTGYTPWGKPAADTIKSFWIGGESNTSANAAGPFGESQSFGTPYCDPTATNVPDHGWGNLSNYSYNGVQLDDMGCIHPGSAADNIYGDQVIGYQGTGTPAESPVVVPPITDTQYPFGESQVSGTPYCNSTDHRVPDHGWGNLENYSSIGSRYRAQGCIYPAGPADNAFGNSALGYQAPGSGEPTGNLPEPPANTDTVFAFGESQKPSVPYCDPADQNIPEHGWGNLENYQVNGARLPATGCIFPEGPADNPSGDPGLE